MFKQLELKKKQAKLHFVSFCRLSLFKKKTCVFNVKWKTSITSIYCKSSDYLLSLYLDKMAPVKILETIQHNNAYT